MTSETRAFAVIGLGAFGARVASELAEYGDEVLGIDMEQILKVMALSTIGVLFIFSGLFVLLASHDLEFLDLAFEVVSAFGTVGLSRGATGELNTVGQLVIIVIMFFGRVGPLTLGFFLATRTAPRIRCPEGSIYLG